MRSLLEYIGIESNKLSQVHKVLGKYYTTDLMSRLESRKSKQESAEKEEAEQQLYNFVLSEPELSSVLKSYNASGNTIKLIYDKMIETGAGQFIKGQWIPASAITNPITLEYLLQKLKGKNLAEESDDVFIIVWNVFDYFKSGSVLPHQMVETKPTFEEFQTILEEIFGQKLNSKAKIAGSDFWDNWDEFTEKIRANRIRIGIDALMLGIKLPEYSRHQTWKGLSIFFFLAALIVVFFHWKTGIGIFILGILFNIYSRITKQRTMQRFTNQILTNVKNNNIKDGFAMLCSHYMAGTLGLIGEFGTTIWPEYPSNSLNGKKELIPNE